MGKEIGPVGNGPENGFEPDIEAGAAELAPLLYPDLRRAARGIRARSSGSALQTTALIHEAYLKMAHVGPWKSHRHFLASTAVAMRHVMLTRCVHVSGCAGARGAPPFRWIYRG